MTEDEDGNRKPKSGRRCKGRRMSDFKRKKSVSVSPMENKGRDLVSSSSLEKKAPEIRKKQLEDEGYNVKNSTFASGFVVGKKNPLLKRSFKPKDDDERLEQSIRQMTTPMLSQYKKGVEIQSMFVPKMNSLFIATNHKEQNIEIYEGIKSKSTPKEFFQEVAEGFRIKDPGRNKRGERKKIPRSQQNNPLKRRSSKFIKGLNMDQEKLEEKRGEKSGQFFSLLKESKKEDVVYFNPNDKKSKFLDDENKEYKKRKIYVLEENLKVEGNSKVEEHAEVNFFPIISELGLKKEEFYIHGPKCPCSTCREKGKSKGIFSDEGPTGKLFPGQIPLTKEGTYQKSFLESVTKRSKKFGHEQSSNYQYGDSESDYSDSDSEDKKRKVSLKRKKSFDDNPRKKVKN